MAVIERYVPIVIYHEASTRDESLSNEQLFAKAKAKAFSNDPDDSGGATMCGVTIATYKEYCKKKGKPTPTVAQLRNMTYTEWFDILKTMFWDKWHASLIENQSLAELLVDWYWCSGVYGIRIPQYRLGVEADGIVGEKTLAAIRKRDQKKLFEEIKLERIAYTERICTSNRRKRKYKKGWLKRINSFTYKA